MDFFEHQDRARSSSKFLIFIFACSLVAIVLAMLMITAAILHIAFKIDPLDFENSFRIYLWVALGTVGLICIASFYKTYLLSHYGGISVALEAGGRPVEPTTKNFKERRLLNIVEEMSIASGVAMPEVFILPEDGINAFAAGNTQRDAAIAVTDGCLDLLNRDELQGVIAHEFSHIFHGDMRLNMRITGVIFGILALTFMGRLLLRYGIGFGGGRRNSKSKGGVIWLALAGVGLLVIGSLGVFFGRIIQSSVSRQREFLADASAVQYTRNPSGISGALQKIGAWVLGSKIENSHKDELSHFFISSPFRASQFTASLMATHPPLANRIRAIDKSWNGEFKSIQSKSEVEQDVQRDTKAEKTLTANVSSSQLKKQIGEINGQHVVMAQLLLFQLPDFIKNNAQETYSARAIVYALFLSQNQMLRAKQLLVIDQHKQADLMPIIERTEDEIQSFGDKARLTTLEIALSGLKRLSPSQRSEFLTTVKDLIMIDQKVEMYEFSLYSILVYHLQPLQKGEAPVVNKAAIVEALSCLASGVAYAGNSDLAATRSAYNAATHELKIKTKPLLDQSLCGPAQLTKSMRTLRNSPPSVKKIAIEALIQCAAHDSIIQIDEIELLRAIGACLEVPIPLSASNE